MPTERPMPQANRLPQDRGSPLHPAAERPIRSPAVDDDIPVPERPAAGPIRPSAEPDDRGATATEYAILIGFIAVAIVLAVTAFGSQLATFFGGLYGALGFR
jgi:Flp pilus assembly pilin Flp